MMGHGIDTERPMRLPPTSLIIPSRNRPRLLGELVAAILDGDEVPSEMVIVDDSDCPNEHLAHLATARDCEVRYLWTRSTGLSRANNTGVAAARHDLLIFAQDDILVTPAWFGTIARALIEAGPQSVVTGQVRPGIAETAGAFAPSTVAGEEPVIYQGRTGKDVLFAQNMAMYRRTITEIGPFDERLGPGTPFPAAEDNDYALRLLERGYRIVYVPQAVVSHRAWRTESDYLPLRWNYGVARGAFYAKHLTLRDRFILRRMARDIAIHAAIFPRRFRSERRRSYGAATLVLGIFYGAIKWTLTQRRSK